MGREVSPVKQVVGGKPEVTLVRSQSSVTISLDGKGVAKYEVKAYGDTMDEALEEAIAAFDELDAKFAGGPQG
jgi:hypothetical protein